jgi:hypothetical protein
VKWFISLAKYEDVHVVSFGEQQLREIGAILPGCPGYKSPTDRNR